jgi:hypothetical protein
VAGVRTAIAAGVVGAAVERRRSPARDQTHQNPAPRAHRPAA